MADIILCSICGCELDENNICKDNKEICEGCDSDSKYDEWG